ncbi:MAG: luciferase [Planctomycetota bacterium]|nr:luciferase [Planctomycetota bacterium]MDG2309504.1 luciferase [Planctomycetota bacterium]
MHFDVFFSICQTPVAGSCPDEAQMFRNFFEQVELADELHYQCAWVAESHLSTEVQKETRQPVVPHFKGEIGLNVDFLQLAQAVFARTKNIEMGSAIMNIICNGGPIAAAERIAAFCSLHGLNQHEQRQIKVGFAAGRFDFMNRAYGITPRTAVEEAAWPALKGMIFREAAHIFLRLLKGEKMSSEDVPVTTLARDNFYSDADWQAVQEANVNMGGEADAVQIEIGRRFVFENIKIIPQDWRRELLDLTVGSHDPKLQTELNEIAPVKVFNLSITSDELINATHDRMAEAFNPAGGEWQRGYMPRTVMVFLNDEPGLSEQQQNEAAAIEAKAALGEYWNAIEGTIDMKKVEGASENALMGSPQQVLQQIKERFHPQDRLMLWFDFYNHDSARVMRNMRAFAEKIIPQVNNGG